MRKLIPANQIKALREAVLQDYWSDYYVNEENHLCSLCGNSGIIDTRETAISGAGVNSGRLNYCICPNGVLMREAKVKLQ